MTAAKGRQAAGAGIALMRRIGSDDPLTFFRRDVQRVLDCQHSIAAVGGEFLRNRITTLETPSNGVKVSQTRPFVALVRDSASR